jgi:hypothetical protein
VWQAMANGDIQGGAISATLAAGNQHLDER